MKGSRKRIINFVLILGTLAVVLVIGISDNSLFEAWEAVRTMNLAWVILAVLCFLCYLMMDTVAIHFFLRRQGYKVLITNMDLVFYKIDEKNKVVTVYAVVDHRQDYLSIIRGL